MWDSIWHDVRTAVRSLVRRRFFSAAVLVLLALGIGGATTIFTLVDGVLIRDLPYKDPASLVNVWRAWPSWQGQGVLDSQWDHIYFPLSDYLAVKDHARTLEPLEAFHVRRLVLSGDGRAEEVSVGRATAGLFPLLGARPLLGRTFRTDETLPVAFRGARVALLSARLWQRRFGADPAILGRTVTLQGEAYEVVGILPTSFNVASDEVLSDDNAGAADTEHRDAWIPLGQDEADCGNCLELIGRLAPGRSAEQARAEVQPLLGAHPNDPPGQLVRVVPFKDRLTEGYGTPLLMLLASAAVLLIVACLNVAGLMVGEAITRRRDNGIQTLLGATRSRLARQSLTESVILGLCGSVVGVLVAWLGTTTLLPFAPPLPRLEEVTVSGRVVAFAAGIGVLSGLLFGLAPLVNVASSDTLTMRGSSHGRRMKFLHRGAVVLQIALTVMLLIGGGLFGRSLTRLMAVDPGFVATGLATLAFEPPATRGTNPETVGEFQRQVLRVAQSVPGVTAVSATSELPFPGSRFGRSFTLGPDGPRADLAMWHRSVEPNYHQVMGIPLLQGRYLTESDNTSAPHVIVVSRSFADQVWPGESSLGKSIYNTGPAGPWTVVGVVADVRQGSIDAPPAPTIYRTTAQVPERRLYLVARTAGDAGAVLRTIRASIWGHDEDTIVAQDALMTALIDRSRANDRFRAVLVWAFAGVASVLAALGVLGMSRRYVMARTREFGIRAALGGTSSGLVWQVLREALYTAAMGVSLGVAVAASVAVALRRLFYQTGAYEPSIYIVVALLAIAVALGAAYGPARRISRIDPAQAMARDD